MRFEWFVARRYLRSPYRPAVLRLVTIFSILGVAAGVATLVIALSMNTGFRETLQDRLLEVTAHVSLTRPGAVIHDYEMLATKLATIPGVRSVTPASYQTVLLSFGGQARGVVAKGVEPERERRGDEALQKIVAGRLDFTPDADGIDALMVGKQLADEWKMVPGDYVTITSPQGRLTPVWLNSAHAPLSRGRSFRFRFLRLRRKLVLLDAARGAGSSWHDRCRQRAGIPTGQSRACAEKSRARQNKWPGRILWPPAGWNKTSRSSVRYAWKNWSTAIFIGLITFVAGLNILVVLSMMVTDKARDIAVLMSMGTRREQIRKIFLWQGIAIGFTGTLIGLCVGYAFALIAGTYHLIPLDPQIYAVSYVPFHPSVLDGVWITVAAMGISIGATILPARAASQLLPVEILRYE